MTRAAGRAHNARMSHPATCQFCNANPATRIRFETDVSPEHVRCDACDAYADSADIGGRDLTAADIAEDRETFANWRAVTGR